VGFLYWCGAAFEAMDSVWLEGARWISYLAVHSESWEKTVGLAGC
jgi:hypothetical protein